MTIQRPSLAGRFARTAVLALITVLLQPAQAQTLTVAAPERAISHAEFQDHLDEVRRHYPKLYDRLRRAPRVDAARQIAATQSAPVPIEIRLQQAVRTSQPTNSLQPMPRGTP